LRPAPSVAHELLDHDECGPCRTPSAAHGEAVLHPRSLAAHFFQDLGGDSLDLAEATMELEERLDVDIPDGEVPPRIQAILDLVWRACQARMAHA